MFFYNPQNGIVGHRHMAVGDLLFCFQETVSHPYLVNKIIQTPCP